MVRDDVIKNLNKVVSMYSNYDLVVVGHSLSASITTLAAAGIQGCGYPLAKIYAFTSPRVANPALPR
jgi:hypothetical protein